MNLPSNFSEVRARQNQHPI